MSHNDSKSFHWFIPAPAVGGIWVLGSGLVDWLTGSELAVSAFYLPGIILTAWISGRKASLWIALLAASIWLTAELAGPIHYSRPFIPYWNAVIRLSIFVVTALLTSEVRMRRQTETALQHQKDIFSSILDSMRDSVVVADHDGRIIVYNPTAQHLFGPVELGRNANDWATQIEENLLDPSPGIHERKHPLRQALAGQFAGPGEISLRKEHSAARTQLGLTALPLVGHDANQAGMILVFNDLTARRNLENQISQASEREQRRIGQDLHDGVCQHLVGVAFAAATLQSELEHMNLPAQAAGAAEIADFVREGIRQTKDLARGLYPTGIEEGLEIALKSLASITRDRLGIPCHYSQTGGDFVLAMTTAGHLYRIAQEAVNNAVRHAKCQNIRIQLTRKADELVLEVMDDGIGLGSSHHPDRGIGLQIMQYRANLVGAKLEISSLQGEGTRICSRVSLPATPP